MPSILYIEDDNINALIVKKLLQKDYEIAIAYDSQTGLDLLKNAKYDLVLLDVNLGEEKTDGVGIMQNIRQNPNNQGIKILAITAFALPEDKEKFIKLGFDDYISKPIDRDSLMTTISSALQKQ